MKRHLPTLLEKSRAHEVRETWTDGEKTEYEVRSGVSGHLYKVLMRPDGGICSCDWGAYRPANDPRAVCSHTVAVYRQIAHQYGLRLGIWQSQEDAARQKKRRFYVGDGVWLTISKVTRRSERDGQG